MAQKESSPSLRLGVDFGYKYTGVALMDGACVLNRAVIIHRTDISETLQTRRENRAMRRRNRSRRKRLRDFRAVLKEMSKSLKIPELAPILPAPDKCARDRPGNLLYGIAHWRGWDYAQIPELLMEESEKGLPGKTPAVRKVDDFLKEQKIALLPAARLKHSSEPKPARKESRSSDSFIRRRGEWEEAGKLLAQGKRPPPNLLRWTELKISCLGGLVDAVRAAHDAKKIADKNPDDENIARAERAQEDADELRERLSNPDEISKEISEWINERLDAVFADELSADKRENLRKKILVLIGLASGREAHKEGKHYRPNRNRHRENALEELRKKMREILSEAGRENECEKWTKRAEAILNQRQRPIRFDNRHPGKCPAITEKIEGKEKTGIRCARNVPRRDKAEIRRLLFEIEARQMNVAPKNEDEPRKLSDDEIRELRDECVNFDKGEILDEKWRAFFKRFPTPPRKRDESGEDLRNKRDQLRDIVRGGGKGRTRYCRAHLAEKALLLKNNETEGDRWAALHGERVFELSDAPPSLRHYAEKILPVVREMLAKEGFANPQNAPVVHVGVESARFDIAALSSLEGRKLKKSAYSQKRGRSLKFLVDAQDGFCLFCGEMMVNATVDHVFARARRGGDAHKNLVAMCADCNIQKWKFADVRLNEEAMNALDENAPDKADFLRKNKGAPFYSNFSAEQTTMFGGAVVADALAKMLIGDMGVPKNIAEKKNRFPAVRAADLARAREEWFPIINRKKRALRAVKPKDGDGVELIIGEILETACELQHPHKPLPGFISAKNGMLSIAPTAADAGVTTLWLKDGDSGRPFRVVVRPAKDDPAREYHHAIDAIVAAAPVDWNRIARMARDAKKRSQKTAAIFEKEIEKVRPLTREGKSPFPDAAPEKDGEWLIESKQDKSGPKRAKTRREPLGIWKNPADPEAKEILVQRKPLDRLARNDVKAITDAAAKIRDALQKAWEKIDELSPEEREEFLETTGSGKARKEYISHRWFLQLPKTHILHPHRTRSAPLKIGNKARVFAVRRKGVLHYFDREVPWEEVAVWETPGGKINFSRRRPKFYINADNPQEWENDKTPPPESKILFRVRRGMSVRINGEPGIWRVTEFNKDGATLIAHDNIAYAAFCAAGKSEQKKTYRKIRPV